MAGSSTSKEKKRKKNKGNKKVWRNKEKGVWCSKEITEKGGGARVLLGEKWVDESPIRLLKIYLPPLHKLICAHTHTHTHIFIYPYLYNLFPITLKESISSITSKYQSLMHLN